MLIKHAEVKRFVFIVKNIRSSNSPGRDIASVRGWGVMNLVVAALSILAVVPISRADAGDALNLSQALQLAREHDARIAAARASLTAGREKAHQGSAQLRPSVSLEANTGYNDLNVQYHGSGPFSAFSGVHRYNSYDVGIVFSQPLYRPENQSRYRASKIESAQAETEYAAAGQNLILRVAQAYFDALLARETLDSLEAQRLAVSQELARAKRAFELGVATVIDEREAQARYDLIQSQEIAARSDLEIRTQALAQLIGREPGRLASLPRETTLTLPAPDEDVAKWQDLAEQGSQAVQLARQARDLANEDVTRQRGARSPALDLVASFSDASQGDSAFGVGMDTRVTAVGVSLTLPLYAGGALDSRVRESAARLDQSEHILEDTIRRARLDAGTAYLRTVSSRALAQALDQALVSSESSLAATKRGLEVGRRTNMDVLNAQQQVQSTWRDLAAARYAYLLNRLQLQAAIGRLSEDDIARVNHLLATTPTATP